MASVWSGAFSVAMSFSARGELAFFGSLECEDPVFEPGSEEVVRFDAPIGGRFDRLGRESEL